MTTYSKMIVTAIALLGATTIPAAMAGDLTDPIEILKKADEASKKIKAVKYESTFEGVDEAKDKVGRVDLTIFKGDASEKFLAEVKAKQAGSEEVKSANAGGDGKNYYVIDHVAKKVYVDPDPAVIGSFQRPIGAAMMQEFGHEKPFSDEINGTKQELRGSKTIAGEECYEVYVEYAGINQEAVWHFSKKDFLPRARMDIRTRDGIKTKTQKTITKLVVDPKVDDETFKMKVPEGYAKIDDFAP